MLCNSYWFLFPSKFSSNHPTEPVLSTIFTVLVSFESFINSFSDIENMCLSELLEDFYVYLLNNVKIIVNSVEKHIESETVFKNLNSNKVPLTEAELIKGLLITKVGRANNNIKGFTDTDK